MTRNIALVNVPWLITGLIAGTAATSTVDKSYSPASFLLFLGPERYFAWLVLTCYPQTGPLPMFQRTLQVFNSEK